MASSETSKIGRLRCCCFNKPAFLTPTTLMKDAIWKSNWTLLATGELYPKPPTTYAYSDNQQYDDRNPFAIVGAFLCQEYRFG